MGEGEGQWSGSGLRLRLGSGLESRSGLGLKVRVRMLPRGLSLLDTAPALRRHQHLELRPHRWREDFRHRHVALACAAATVAPGRLGPGRSLRVAAGPWAGRLARVCVCGRTRPGAAECVAGGICGRHLHLYLRRRAPGSSMKLCTPSISLLWWSSSRVVQYSHANPNPNPWPLTCYSRRRHV